MGDFYLRKRPEISKKSPPKIVKVVDFKKFCKP